MQKQPFAPHYGSGQLLAVTAASQTATIDLDAKNITFTNLGTTVVYVRAVADGSAATTADYPIPPGVKETVTKSETVNTLTYIGTVGGSLHVITGEGF